MRAMGGARAAMGFAVLAACLAGLLAVAGCQQNVDNFRKVESGWSLDEVRGLLGEPDEITEAKGVAAQWVYHSDEPWGGGATLIVNSVGGKVVFTTLSKPK